MTHTVDVVVGVAYMLTWINHRSVGVVTWLLSTNRWTLTFLLLTCYVDCKYNWDFFMLVENWQLSDKDEEEMRMGVERVRLSMPSTATSTNSRYPITGEHGGAGHCYCCLPCCIVSDVVTWGCR